MNTFDPITIADLVLQVAAAITLVVLCELAKRRFSK
jgi:hypothetical protein